MFTYNPCSKQLILLVIEKLDASFVPSCGRHHSVLEDMIPASVRFPMFEASALYEQIDSSFKFIYRDTFFLSGQKFSFFTAFTDLLLISKL